MCYVSHEVVSTSAIQGKSNVSVATFIDGRERHFWVLISARDTVNTSGTVSQDVNRSRGNEDAVRLSCIFCTRATTEL